jgi:hypothetical protein
MPHVATVNPHKEGPKMLEEEIENAQRLVKMDAYQLSIGEVVNIYKDGEFIINPDFQRTPRNSGIASLLWSTGATLRLRKANPVPSDFGDSNDALKDSYL